MTFGATAVAHIPSTTVTTPTPTAAVTTLAATMVAAPVAAPVTTHATSCAAEFDKGGRCSSGDDGKFQNCEQSNWDIFHGP